VKLISWNVNGLRAAIKKDFYASLETMQPDILCLQETKAQDEQVAQALDELEGYYVYCNSAEKKGYSGTALITRKQPISVTLDIGLKEHDQEGRVICAEYEDFILVTVYVPNSGSELKRLVYRQSWDAAFLAYLKTLEQRKPVIVCGDFNVAHQAIDLARPKQNYNKSAGYMQEEIDGMNNFIQAGLVDTFRHFHPETIKYSWWSYRAGARAKNVGWRIDYFLCSERITPQLKNTGIENDIFGSDHCPVYLELK